MLHVRMVAIGHVNALPAANLAFVLIVAVFETVKVVQVPADRGVFAVDLKRIQSLVATSLTRGFKQAQRAVGEVAQEGTGIVNADLLDLARERVGALFDERLGHG